MRLTRRRKPLDEGASSSSSVEAMASSSSSAAAAALVVTEQPNHPPPYSHHLVVVIPKHDGADDDDDPNNNNNHRHTGHDEEGPETPKEMYYRIPKRRVRWRRRRKRPHPEQQQQQQQQAPWQRLAATVAASVAAVVVSFSRWHDDDDDDNDDKGGGCCRRAASSSSSSYSPRTPPAVVMAGRHRRNRHYYYFCCCPRANVLFLWFVIIATMLLAMNVAMLLSWPVALGDSNNGSGSMLTTSSSSSSTSALSASWMQRRVNNQVALSFSSAVPAAAANAASHVTTRNNSLGSNGSRSRKSTHIHKVPPVLLPAPPPQRNMIGTGNVPWSEPFERPSLLTVGAYYDYHFNHNNNNSSIILQPQQQQPERHPILTRPAATDIYATMPMPSSNRGDLERQQQQQQQQLVGDDEHEEDSNEEEPGGVEVRAESLRGGGPLFQRVMDPDDYEQNEQRRDKYLTLLDKKHISESYESYEEKSYPRECVKPKWAYNTYTNCNTFHELALERLPGSEVHQQQQQQHVRMLQQYNVTYLAHGYYRETYLFQPYHQQRLSIQTKTTMDPFVLKHIRLTSGVRVDYWFLNSMHSEALVMERLSGSDRISHIYGYCATSNLVQPARDITNWIVPKYPWQRSRGRIEQAQLDRLERPAQPHNNRSSSSISNGTAPAALLPHNNTNNNNATAPAIGSRDGVFPLNHFTPIEKAYIALSMAEALAEMHGFAGGVMVHDDFHPDQFLVTAEGQLILNDINNAEVLPWNVKHRAYCKYWISYGGDFRAPEEYQGDYVDESVDIWPMGNMIFSLLTGLWPYYRQFSEDNIEKTSMQGVKPYLNPRYANRSYIESRLVALMDLCFKLRPKERVDIFYIVQHLRDAIQQYWEQQTHNNHHQEVPMDQSKFVIRPPPPDFDVPAPA